MMEPLDQMADLVDVSNWASDIFVVELDCACSWKPNKQPHVNQQMGPKSHFLVDIQQMGLPGTIRRNYSSEMQSHG